MDIKILRVSFITNINITNNLGYIMYKKYSRKEKEIIEAKGFWWRMAGLKACDCTHYEFDHEGGIFSTSSSCKSCTCDKFKWIGEED